MAHIDIFRFLRFLGDRRKPIVLPCPEPALRLRENPRL